MPGPLSPADDEDSGWAFDNIDSLAGGNSRRRSKPGSHRRRQEAEPDHDRRRHSPPRGPSPHQRPHPSRDSHQRHRNPEDGRREPPEETHSTGSRHEHERRHEPHGPHHDHRRERPNETSSKRENDENGDKGPTAGTPGPQCEGKPPMSSTHRTPSPNSSTAPFARLLAEYTFDAAKILGLMFSSMWALVPTSLLAGIARNICTIAIALLMAWIIINHLLYLTSQAFCAALTHLPDHLSVNIEGCIPNTQEPDELGLLLQSLDGLSPLVPDAFQFLSNSLADVDDKVSIMKGLIDTSQLELSTTAWKEKYIKGAQCVRDSERDFVDQQRRLWESVNRYIGTFSPGNKKEPSWLDSIMGSQTRRRREAVKERRSELLSVLMHAENRTSTSYTNLPIHHGKGVLNKLYNQEASQFARDITEILGAYSSCDGKDVLAVQLKELQASSTVWTASSEALSSRLDKRSKMLEEDLNWLRSSLDQLKELEGKLGKMAQMEQLDNCQERISQMAQEWRSRLRGYFVESSSKM